MPYSPLISKIRVHNPNKKGSRAANRNYLNYIATREGVDVTEVKDINDLLKYDKVVESEINDNVVHQMSDNESYLRYMAKRPRSHGLFGNIDIIDIKEVSRNISELTKDGRLIYRGIVNIWQKDAEELGYTEKEQWNLYLKRVLPDIAKELGVSSTNFSWVAAFHAEKEHPHVHFMLWDNTKKVKSPFIHTSVQHKCRQIFSEAMFSEEYENMIKEIFRSEREELNQIRNYSRSQLTETTKEIMNELFVPGMKINTLPDRITLNEIKVLEKELIKLAETLPEKGSVDYAYLKPNIKHEVDNISSLILKRVDISKEYAAYIKAVVDGQKLIGKNKFEISIAKEKAEKDINKRIGNIIIKKAKEIREYSNFNDLKKEKYMISKELSDKNLLFNLNVGHDTNYKDFYESVDFSISEENRDNVDYESISDNEKFFIAWNENYKNALEYLYNSSKQDFNIAFNLMTVEASKKNVLAIHDLGKIYEKGLGKDIDLELAEEFYKRACVGFMEIEKDNPHKYIQYRIGKLYEAGRGITQNYSEAFKWYENAANQGHKYAQYSLGMLYLHGKGINADLDKKFCQKEAMALFKKSAEQGNPYASFEMAKLLEKGIIDKPNIYDAQKYYKKAFDGFQKMLEQREDDNLLYRVGKMYYEGLGTEKNEFIGIRYLEKAAKLNNINAQYALAQIYIRSNDSKIYEAIGWLTKLAEADHDMAQYSLGRIYLEGKLIDKNIIEAIELLSKSADKGNQFAQYQLGLLYYKGEEVNQDINKALDYLCKSADQENNFAEYTLGKIYSDAELGYYDINKAVELYTRSADQGNQFAQFQLGNMYLWGKKVQQNEELGYYWLNKAIEQGNEYALQSLETYQKYQSTYLPGVIYGMVKSIFSSLQQQNYELTAKDDYRRFRTKSKQVKKEDALHNRNKQHEV